MNLDELIKSLFWLDPSDPHRMRSAIQVLDRPHYNAYLVANLDWPLTRVFQDQILEQAVHRVVTEGVSPQQAVGEAIARIRQILAETACSGSSGLLSPGDS
jgi:hypothetical protein